MNLDLRVSSAAFKTTGRAVANDRSNMRYLLLFPLAFAATTCCAQVETYHVRPVQTHPGYDPAEDSSAVSRNTVLQVDKLFLFLGGTGSSSSSAYGALRLFAAGLGFDVISLSYPNDVATASLTNDTDTMVFDKYRQEACYGTPLSDDVDIDSLNSIHTRTVNLLLYLDFNHPSQNWGQYLATASTLDWSRIIVGGHSQGSGHACYLAKHHPVDRVLMFSGPNDYSDHYSNSANWVRQAGVTPVGRHYSYLSLNDEAVAYSKQMEVIDGLDMLANDDTTHVDLLPSPYGNSHCLYTTQPPGIALLHHNVPIKQSTINNGVWTYMLTSPIPMGISDGNAVPGLHVFPIPATSVVEIVSSRSMHGKVYALRNISGATLVHGMITGTDRFTMDLSGLRPGVYCLWIDDQVIKVVKH